jgi:hypothetical protein
VRCLVQINELIVRSEDNEIQVDEGKMPCVIKKLNFIRNNPS